VRIVWTHAAIRDLIRIRRYIERDNPLPASSVATRILKAVSQLAAHPQMGRFGRLSGTRELVISQTPYLVPYRLQGEAIELLRVIHSRQQWPVRKGRQKQSLQPTRRPRHRTPRREQGN
jgi:toxin ParE1/3/4